MFHTLFFQPLYNALVLISSLVPGGDIGLAIIILTILVKVVLFPLFQKATLTQMKMKEVEPEMNRIKEVYKDDKETQTRKILDLYRTNKINPLSSILVLFIQIPIILALFWVFNGDFNFNPAELYSFVKLPAEHSVLLFGLVDITKKSLLLAIITGVTQFIQTHLSLPKVEKKKSDTPNFKEDFARSMNMNMRYFMPLFIGFISYTLSSAIAIYWITSNLFTIGQEYYLRNKRKLAA